MKQVITLLALGLLTIAGCITLPAPVPVAPATRTTPQTAAPVRPEQVTPQTAQKMSQALADELDREAQQEISGPAAPKR